MNEFVVSLPRGDNLFLLNFLNYVLPYVAYFVGTFVRKYGFPSDNSPSLKKQLLLCIPFSLLIVSPYIGIIHILLPASLLFR